MKKLMILAAVAMMAVCSQAAAFKFQAGNQYAADLVNKYTGDITLYCVEVAAWTETGTCANGVVAASSNTFESDLFTAGETYTFYYTVTDAGKMYTSSTKAIAAQSSDVVQVAIGNQTASNQAANWQTVPEPTSGLLLLLGVAGLTLKRRRA